MNLFGSREEDPLLQNDPLAPSSEDSPDDPAPSDNPSSEENADPSASEEPSPSDDSDERAGQPRSSLEEGGGSVFGPCPPSAPADAPADGNRPRRTLTHTVAEAADGELAALNAALDAGWRLDRVEVRTAPEAPTDAPPAGDRSATIAFLLWRPDAR